MTGYCIDCCRLTNGIRNIQVNDKMAVCEVKSRHVRDGPKRMNDSTLSDMQPVYIQLIVQPAV
jgi:hypothetical protein